MLSDVSHVERRQSRETSHEKPGARQHDDRQRDLRRNEELPDLPQASSLGSGSSIGPKRRRQIEITEGPELGWINFRGLLPSPFPRVAVAAPAEARSGFAPAEPPSPFAPLPELERAYVEQAVRMSGHPMVMMSPLSLSGIDLCVPAYGE